MCAAWKKKNERNEIACFYSTQSDILLCGIARFIRGNKKKLRTFRPQKWKKLRAASLKQNLLVLVKKRVYLRITQNSTISVFSIPIEVMLSMYFEKMQFMYFYRSSRIFGFRRLFHNFFSPALFAKMSETNVRACFILP